MRSSKSAETQLKHCAALPDRALADANVSGELTSLFGSDISKIWQKIRPNYSDAADRPPACSAQSDVESAEAMKRAFHQTALQYLDGLFGYAMTLTHNQAEAEDLVQETYLRATRAAVRLAPDSRIKSWLFTILRNLFLNQIRHRRAGPALLDIESESGVTLPLADEETPDPLSSFLGEEQQREVRRAITSLPESFREVIILREFEELSYREIAEVLDCPIGTVMSRLGRARDQLRQKLQGGHKERTA